MKQCLVAKNGRQIDMILKSIYIKARNEPFEVKIIELESGKLNYQVWVDTTEEKFSELKAFVEIMCS